jgi:hypothetical protein
VTLTFSAGYIATGMYAAPCIVMADAILAENRQRSPAL